MAKKISKKRINIIQGALSAGSTPRSAASIAGVNASTLYHWMQRGTREEEEGKRSLYTACVQAVRTARAEIEGVAMGANFNAMQGGDAKVALAFLAKRRPQEWGTAPVEEYHPETLPENLDDEAGEALDEQGMRERIFGAFLGSRHRTEKYRSKAQSGFIPGRDGPRFSLRCC